jgi:hypothetical protein
VAGLLGRRRVKRIAQPVIYHTQITTTASLTDAVTLSDTIARSAQTFTRTTTDSLTATDSVTRAAQSFTRALTDSVSITDTIARSAQTFTRSTSDTVTLSDAVTRSSQSFSRTTSDAAAITDTVARAAQSFTRPLTDAVSITDTASRAISRTLTDAVSLTDADTRAAQVFTRAAADAAAITDAVTRAAQTRTRAVADSLSATDAVTRAAQTRTRTLTDTVSVVDNAARSAQSFPRTLTDAVGLSDGSPATSNTLFTFDSGIQGWAGEGSATVSAESTIVHDGAGSLHIAQTVASGLGQVVRANDSNGNTAVESAGATLSVWCFIPTGTPGTTWRANIELQDSSFSYHNGPDVAITKGTWTQVTYRPPDTVWSAHKAIAVQFTVDDATGTTCDLYIDTVTQFNLNTLPTRSFSMARTTADTLGLSDTVARTVGRTTTDSVTVSDAVARAAQTRTRTLSDTVGLTDAVVTSVARSFATIGATTSPQIAAVAAAGLTHNVVVAFWDQLQPSGAGTALDATALAALNTVIGLNITNGLKTVLEHALHYPPSWVASAVEPFKDQAGNVWSGSSGNGDQVRNWMWTSLGRTYVADFISKVYAGLTSTNRAAVDRIRFGGGVFGELHYPTTAVASPYSYWAFGTSMQTGTGLATGLTAAPDVAYTPFTGTTTQDNNFIAWYIGGITNWMTWYAGQLTSAGWTCDLMCLHPGYGIRSNQVHSDAGFRQALSCGEDPATVIAAYASNPQVWPWCTWINGTDGFIPPSVDSDQAAWKKVFAEAYKNNKHARIWGENTGGESNAGMDSVFHNAMIRSLTPIAGDPIYPSGTTPPAVFPGYSGMMWLNYSSLTAGGANATLANYQGLVTHVWPTTYKRGIADSGGEFGSSVIPGVYGTDYHYDSATSVSYLAGRGHKIVRFPFLWERIQHTLGAALDTTELGRLQTYVANAASAGIGVVLDVHNYCRYSISGTTHVLGDGTLTQAHFVDLWTRLSTAFNGVAGIAGYGLMNEPHDLTGTTGSYTPASTLYDFDTSVQGWVEETSTGTVTDQASVVHDGAKALQVVKTVSSGSPNIRINDAAGNSAVITGGQTIAAWVQVASGTAGTWTAHMEMQNSSFAWQAGSDFSLTPGTWTLITYTPSSAIWSGHHGIGIQFTGSGISGTPSVTVYADTVSQGTLTGSLTAPQVWEQAAQAAVTAIRGNSDTTPIMVGGYDFSSADQWPVSHPAAFITDSANNTYYEAHLYFDDNASGTYSNSFATETTDANGESFYSVVGRARTRLSHFTDWCATQGVKGFIGEVGWPNGSDATSWNAVGEAIYKDCDLAGFWVSYWSSGEWFGTTYALSAYVEHSGGTALDTANAQAPIIEAHPSVLAVPATSPAQPIVVTDLTGAYRAMAARSGGAIVSRPAVVAPSIRTVTDAATISDVIARGAQTFTRTTTDSLTATDSVTRAAQSFTRALTDSVSITDTIARSAQTFTRALADVLGLTDQLTKGGNRTTTDTLGLSDVVGRAAQVFTRTVSDAVSVSDAVARQMLFMRPLADSLTVSDTASRAAQVFTRALVDSLSVSDADARAAQVFTRGLSDGLTLSDAAARAVQVFTRILTDSVTAGDTVTRVAQVFTRTLSDTATLTDSATKGGGQSRSTTDTLTATDIVRAAVAWLRSTVDTLTASDALSRATVLVRGLADTVSITDVTVPHSPAFRTITDTLAVTDVVAEAAHLTRAAADALAAADTVVAKVRATSAVDTLILLDGVTGHLVVLPLHAGTPTLLGAYLADIPTASGVLSAGTPVVAY